MQGDINQQGGAFILGPGWCNGRIILSLSADVCFYQYLLDISYQQSQFFRMRLMDYAAVVMSKGLKMCTGDNVLFAHRDNSAIDHVPINDLLGLAGVAQVNFDGDKRVLAV